MKKYVAVFLMLLLLLTGCSGNDLNTKGRMGAEIVNEPSKEGRYVVSKNEHVALVVDATPKNFSSNGGLEEFYNAISFSGMPVNVEIGQRVLVEIDGPILESFPAQAKVKKVEILPTYKPDHADLTEAEVVKEALKIANEKSKWVPAIRHVEFDEASDNWKVGIKQEDDLYEVEVEDIKSD